MNKQSKLTLVLAAIAVVAGAVAWWHQAGSPDAPVHDYTQGTLQQGSINAVVSATGTLNAVNTVQVGSQVSGSIAQLYADFNEPVKKGQLIAQIDPAVFAAKVAEAMAKLKSAQAGVAKAQVAVLDAKTEFDRQQGLFDKKLVAENVRDAARFAHQSATVEHEFRLAAVAEAEAALQREQVNLDYTAIHAPIEGVVISRDVEVGQTVAASLQAPTLFTIADDLARMQVEAEVDEAYIGKVAAGQSVRFSVFAYPGRTFDGQVTQVRLQPKVESGVVKYNCIIEVDNGDLALKPGMTATVAIQVAQRDGVLQVPASALRFVPDWSQDRLDALRDGLAAGERMLWTLERGEPHPIKVRTGIEGPRQVEVIGDGLRPDMTVLLPEKRSKERKRAFGVSLF